VEQAEEGRLRAALSPSGLGTGSPVHTSWAMRPLLLSAALLVGLIAMPFTAGARTRPSVTVPRLVPVVVKGSSFVSGERIKVVIRIPLAYRKWVTASSRGRFTATFRVAAGKCVTIRVSAVGNKGSRASTTVPGNCGV